MKANGHSGKLPAKSVKSTNAAKGFLGIPGTVVFDDLPTWMQADPLIRRGYRQQLYNIRNCVLSVFYIHNEFVNIWSHLVPGSIHLMMLAREARIALKDGPAYGGEMAMIQVYVLSSIFCLLFSSAYHIMAAHSESVATRMLKLDYLGIVLNVGATGITSSWFGFRKQPDLGNIYVTITLALSIVVLFLFLKPNADGSAAALWRSIVIAGLVASGYVPMIQTWFTQGMDGLQYFPWFSALIMNGLDFTGALFYVTRFPESRYPETFDIWGSSHQIFHTMIVFGQLVYIDGLKNLVGQV